MTLPSALPNTAISLAEYAAFISYDECAFFGVAYDGQEQFDCRTQWTEAQRLAIAGALANAQTLLQDMLGFYLYPTWVTDEQDYISRLLLAQYGNLIQTGKQAISTLAAGRVVSYTGEPAVVGPFAATIGNTSEVKVYYPGSEREITPSKITYSGGNLTIEIPRCRLVNNVINPKWGWAYTDLSNFLTTVDVKRIYNDATVTAELVASQPNCAETVTNVCAYIRHKRRGEITLDSTTCVVSYCAGEQHLVRLYYQSGLTSLDVTMKEAIIRLAHTLLPEEICNQCDVIHRLWKRDTTIPAVLTRERINNPLGMTDGAVWAYNVARSRKLWRGSSI